MNVEVICIDYCDTCVGLSENLKKFLLPGLYYIQTAPGRAKNCVLDEGTLRKSYVLALFLLCTYNGRTGRTDSPILPLRCLDISIPVLQFPINGGWW